MLRHQIDHRPAVPIVPVPSPALQRVRAAGRLSFRATAGVTHVADLYQEGACRLRLPRIAPGEPPEAITINTAGGLTGGDRVDLSVALDDGAAAVVTSQACEKIYRAAADEARIRTSITLAPGSHLDWLAQPMIVFNRARVRRTLSVEMADDAAFLGVESVILGRTAMGETVSHGAVHEAWRIRRGGRLIYADAFRAEGNVADILSAPATGLGARATGTIVHCAPEAEAALPRAREIVGDLRSEAAASAWNGLLMVRLVSHDGQALLTDLSRFFTAYRGRPMPRTWLC